MPRKARNEDQENMTTEGEVDAAGDVVESKPDDVEVETSDDPVKSGEEEATKKVDGEPMYTVRVTMEYQAPVGDNSDLRGDWQDAALLNAKRAWAGEIGNLTREDVEISEDN